MTLTPIRWLKLRFWVTRLKSSGLFHADWYLSRNPDVAESGMDPLLHYLKFGSAEGRDPHPAFLSNWYVMEYEDAANSRYPPLVHYYLAGKKKGYKPHPIFEDFDSWSASRNHPVDSPKPRFDIRQGIKIGFAVTSFSPTTMAGDYFTALELATALQNDFGWEPRFLARDDSERNWYNVSGLDILIVMLDDYDLERIYGASNNFKTIAWMRNWFDRWAQRPWIRKYNLCLCSSKVAKNYLIHEQNIDSQVLRLATNPSRFNEFVPEAPQFSSDYCFTGNYWGSPREIEQFSPANLPYSFALFGKDWQKNTNFAQFHRGEVPYVQMNAVYASTKLLIDDANPATKPWGSVNSRVFDALASGVLVVTNGTVGANEVFGDLLPVYDSTARLEQLIHRFLSSDSERIENVKTLQNLVLTEHTYSHRASQLLKLIRLN